jgi:two-component system, OmpR family, sensor histidine kinase MtrB
MRATKEKPAALDESPPNQPLPSEARWLRRSGDLRVRGSLAFAETRFAVRRGLARLRVRWRRSLQLRVAVSTLLLSTIVVGLVGAVLVQRIVTGLVDAKQRVALSEATAGFTAADQLAAQSTGSPNLTINALAREVANRGGSPEEGVSLVILGTGEDATGRAVPDDVLDSSVPPALRRAMSGPAAPPAYAYTLLRHRDGRSEPALAIGSPLFFPNSTQVYQLYYLFPLDQERATTALVRGTVALTSGLLVLLLGGIAWLVTRQVVTPVRLAAHAAERLSAGKLTERMAVRGEDDLTRLALSFNRMAGNLQRQIEQLEELSRLQRRFVSDVSHELRTPLTTVRMAADVLYEARADFPQQIARSAELLQTELNRFEALLADLLEISRYDAGAAVLDPEPTDLGLLIHGVTAAVDPLAARRGTQISVRLPSVPCVADVDSRRVDRVLRNLLVNAVEHSEGRPVEITVGQDETAVAITVRDSGVGLRPEQVTQVFDRFWRADPARARTTGGTGLGLSIAMEDTHLHGGWLQAWGRPGEGSQFRLTLPRRAGVELTGSPLPLEPADSGAPRPAIPVESSDG